jgi:hypothetical protein
MPKWKDISENVSGNLHDVAHYLNGYVTEKHPDHEVVAMSSSGYNSVVVYRIPVFKLNIQVK